LDRIGMMLSGVPIPGFRAPKRALRRVPCTALLALGVGWVAAGPAAAWEELKAPEYSISVVEGESTHPLESILSTSGSVRLPHDKEVNAALRIVRGGLTVGEETGSEHVWLSQVPEVGDVVELEAPAGSGSIVGSVVYDGLPAMEPTVCAGSTNFSGQRSSNEEVEGSYYTVVTHPTYTAHRRGGEAQITSLSGSSFAGDFLKPLELGETVRAVEHLKTSLAEGATFTYSSENDRPVGACPVPPAPPPPPPVPALQGSIFKLLRTTILRLLRSGWQDQVTINQPGTVTQDLYQLGGAVPASASAAHGKSAHRRRHRPPAVLLARGSATAAAAGKVNVMLHATAKGRRALSHSRRVRAELITTLKAHSGAKLNLEARAVTLDR
jgi:hypothetical protein